MLSTTFKVYRGYKVSVSNSDSVGFIFQRIEIKLRLEVRLLSLSGNADFWPLAQLHLGDFQDPRLLFSTNATASHNMHCVYIY